MANVDRSRTVAAVPQDVWEVLADFGSISSWADGVDHSCLLNQSSRPVGTARRIQAARNVFVERITKFDAPHALGYHIEGLPEYFGKVANRWTLRPCGDNTTMVTLTSTVEIGPWPWQQLAERVLCRLLARSSGAMLAGLANRSEKPCA